MDCGIFIQWNTTILLNNKKELLIDIKWTILRSYAKYKKPVTKLSQLCKIPLTAELRCRNRIRTETDSGRQILSRKGIFWSDWNIIYILIEVSYTGGCLSKLN